MARRRKKVIKATDTRKYSFSSKKSLKQRVLITLIISASIISIIAFIGYHQALNYLQSERFRAFAEQSSQTAIGASDLQIAQPLSIDGNNLYLPAISVEMGNQDVELQIEGLNADINRTSLWNNELHLRKIIIAESHQQISSLAPVQYIIAQPKSRTESTKTSSTLMSLPDKESRESSPSEDTNPVETKEKPSFLQRIKPEKITLDELVLKNNSISIHAGEKLYQIKGSHIIAKPMSPLSISTHNWRLQLENGVLKLPLSFIQESSIKSATINTTKTSIILNNASLLLSPGELIAQGAYQNNNQQWRLKLRANKANVARIIKDDWRRIIKGELYGSMNLEGKRGKIERARGDASILKGEIEMLPFLGSICYDGSYPYRHITLERATCHISYPYESKQLNIHNSWLIDKIDIRAHGKIRIKGQIIIGDDKSLTGNLRVGLPEHIVNHVVMGMQPAIDQIFNAGKSDGYLWLSINLSGSIDQPREDLSIRVKSLFGASLLEGAANQLLNRAGRLIQGASPKQGKKDSRPERPESSPSIRNGNDLIRSGLQSIF